MEIVSALHQRFGPADYTCYLGWLLGRGLSTPEKSQLKALGQDAREKEEKERLIRQRVLLKVVTELWLVGLLRSLDDVARPEDATARGKENIGPAPSKLNEAMSRAKVGQGAGKTVQSSDAEPFPLEVLKDLLGHDREHSNLPLVVQFIKSFAWDILGATSAAEEGRKTAEVNGPATGATSETEYQSSADEDARPSSTVNDPPLTTSELQQRFRNILLRYFEDVKQHIVNCQKSISNQAKRNAEAYVKSGEVFEDRQANYDRQLKAQERMVANAQALCDVLGAEMPDLKQKDAHDAAGVGGIGLVKAGDYLRGQADGAGIWEDDEERRFYENLIDLQDRVPGILLEDGKKKRAEDSQVGKRQDQAPSANGVKTASEKLEVSAADDQSTIIANKTVGAQVDALLIRLPDLQTKEMVDQAAVDFCFLNSKASRNRLIKAVQEVPKGRSDLMPLYSRLVATLGRYLPDILNGLVSYLDEEFRSLQRRKQKDFLGQVRTGNIRYLAELTKFGIVPEHVIFHCLKVSLDDFSRMNIEIICNLLENCGRYLLRNPDTAPRATSFLETLQRKKAAQHLGPQERMLIENAIYYVNPPERAAIQQKERTPVELFISKLIYLDMNKRNYPKVLKSIRKLHWEEQEVVNILEKIFSKPEKLKHSCIHLLAIIIGSLYRYHTGFVITCIDNLLERITLGLEQNDFKYNQRRISEAKYLGELYNYKMVDSFVIFDVLYRLVGFGHSNATPVRERINPLDPPDDFFRIRLVCTILDTCGFCFDRGAGKKKLDFFLTFFQYYLHTKEPLPMEIEFIVHDMYAFTRPEWKLAASYEEAGRAFAELVAHNYKIQEPEKMVEAEPVEDGIFSSDEADEDEPPIPDMEDGHSSSDGTEVEPLVNEGNKAESDFGEDIVVTRQEEERDPEAEAEFDRELAKMMSESLDSRKFDRKPMFDVPLPMRRAQKDASMAAEDSPNEGTATPPGTMAFSLMTKKGTRQQTRTIEMPSDSQFAIAMKNQQEADRAEQQRIKNLVLNYDLQGSSTEQSGLGGERHQHNASLHQASPSNAGARPPADKSSANRSGQRARKLQLSDVDWT